jgi:hypothetical protein
MGNYDNNMKQLARDMRKAHGDLTEVYFIEKGEYQTILHFSDGTYFPTKPKTDRDFNILKYAFQNYSYIPPEGQVDPLPLLTFGYSGTGPQCFEVFLSSFGFKMSNVENVSSGKKLTKNGELLEFGTIPPTQISMKGKKGQYFPDGKADSTSTSGQASSRCFVATAAYGTPLAPEIIFLKDFRDNVLLKYKIGKLLVLSYENISPPIALIIQRRALFRLIIRKTIIAPLVHIIKNLRGGL